MKRNVIILCSLLILGFSSQSFAAYFINWMYVQHRVYEDGHDSNRLNFGIIDDSTGEYVTQNLLTSCTLTKKGTELPLLPGSFWEDVNLFAYYNSGTGYWNYDGAPSYESGYSYNVDIAKLTHGTYKLNIVYDGVPLAASFFLDRLYNLPLIKSASVKSSTDAKGNLYLRWRTPNKLFIMTDTDSPPALSARAFIDVYQGANYVGGLTVKVPTHMDMIFVPSRIIDWVKSQGDTYKFVIQVRTNDNNNRSYSDSVDLSL